MECLVCLDSSVPMTLVVDTPQLEGMALKGMHLVPGRFI